MTAKTPRKDKRAAAMSTQQEYGDGRPIPIIPTEVLRQYQADRIETLQQEEGEPCIKRQQSEAWMRVLTKQLSARHAITRPADGFCTDVEMQDMQDLGLLISEFRVVHDVCVQLYQITGSIKILNRLAVLRAARGY